MELIVKIITYVLAGISGLIVIILDYIYEKESYWFNKLRWVAVIVFLLSFSAGLITMITDHINTNEQINTLNKKISELSDDLKKSSQPIRDMYVSFNVDIPITHHALEAYRNKLKDSVRDMLKSQELKYGVYVSRQEKNGKVLSLGIPLESELFHKRNSDPLAYHLINFVGVRINFYRGVYEFSSDLKNPDLRCIALLSINNTSKNNREPWTHANLFYNLEKFILNVFASDIPCPSREWRGTDRISSIPDLSDSMMVVSFDGFLRTTQQILFSKSLTF